jgi:hypothetical protein
MFTDDKPVKITDTDPYFRMKRVYKPYDPKDYEYINSYDILVSDPSGKEAADDDSNYEL